MSGIKKSSGFLINLNEPPWFTINKYSVSRDDFKRYRFDVLVKFLL